MNATVLITLHLKNCPNRQRGEIVFSFFWIWGGSIMGEQKQTKMDGLSRKQISALPHFIAPKSIEVGCRAAKISKSTFYEWLQDNAFKVALDTLRTQTITGAIDCLKAGIVGAVEKLLTLLNSKDESIRLRASQTAIDYYLKIVTAAQFETRLALLEETLKTKEALK